MDAIDREILRSLQKQGRITNAQLASEVGISPPAMLERVKRLEAAGVIRGYAALVDAEKVGRSVIVMVTVTLAVHQLPSIDAFTTAIDEMDEVLECYHVTGAGDFVIKVFVKSIAEYETFLLNKLTRVPGVNHINSAFVLSTMKYKTTIPIDDM